MLAATVWDMLTTGEATAVEAGQCITAVLAAETSDAVIEELLKSVPMPRSGM